MLAGVLSQSSPTFLEQKGEAEKCVCTCVHVQKGACMVVMPASAHMCKRITCTCNNAGDSAGACMPMQVGL